MVRIRMLASIFALWRPRFVILFAAESSAMNPLLPENSGPAEWKEATAEIS